MLYGAIDIHKAVFQAAVLDPESAELSERRFAATREGPVARKIARRAFHVLNAQAADI